MVSQIMSIFKPCYTDYHKRNVKTLIIERDTLNMRKIYSSYLHFFTSGLFLATLFFTSCKKDHNSTPAPVPKPIATLGLYEANSGIYKRLYIPISKVGTQGDSVYYSVFDTGSTGMTIDATGLLPKSMITNNGITVAGDSVTVNGITVTNQTAVIAYGNTQSEIQEFGNLAYAAVTIGDQNGSTTTSRIPIFLYYKILDVTSGKNQPAHSNDVFGVGPGVSFANSAIGSPLSYFKTAAEVTSGFKLAKVNNASFSSNGTYVSGLLTIGLVPDDLAINGFVMHNLSYFTQGGYSPDIPATISYNGANVPGTILFDTGTPAITIIANQSAASNSSYLPANTTVTITTGKGFSYTYTTQSNNDETVVAKPSFTGDPRTIFSLNFFTDNEYLLDYTDHKIGLKNN
jgi:hypothetical protein